MSEHIFEKWLMQLRFTQIDKQTLAEGLGQISFDTCSINSAIG